MNFSSCLTGARLACLLVVLTTSNVAHAAPGAHGPNGEHLDAPSASQAVKDGVPRFEAKSETFELVGRLQGGELSMLINRFETNEPVLDATVEIEAGDLKAPAKFHADLGDYAVDDAAMLKRLGEVGEHALVITVVAGKDGDLLDGLLSVVSPAAAASAGDHGHDHGTPTDGQGHGRRWPWAVGVMCALVFGFGAGRVSRRGQRLPGGPQ